VSFNAVIDKNVISNIERIHVQVKIDHSKCNVPATSISVKFEQRISLISDLLLFGSKNFQTSFTLVETHDQGLRANDPVVFEKILPLDLSTIRYSVPQTKEKKGV
jgi:hypothetical protein